MFKKVNDITYRFNVGSKTIGVDVLDNGVIEVYDEEDPVHTGFILDGMKQFIALINNMADIADFLTEEQENEI